MKTTTLSLIGFLLIVSIGCSVSPKGKSVSEQQTSVIEEEQRILNEAFQAEPKLADKVRNAPGYGVFIYRSSKLPIILGGVGGGGGYGIITDNSTNKRTFMKVSKAEWGWGMGTRDEAVILVFKTNEALERISQRLVHMGSEAQAAAKAGQVGTALGHSGSFGKDIDSYVLTKHGVSYGITYKRITFKPDQKLGTH